MAAFLVADEAVAHPRLALRLGVAMACTFAGAIGCPPPASTIVAEPARLPPVVRSLPSRPPVAVVAREGDPRAALAVAVLTAGVDDAAGPRLPVALAAMTEARLAAQGVRDVTVASTWDGYRVRALLPDSADGASTLVHALRGALVSPVAADGSDLAAAGRKLAVLARHPVHDPALVEAARCSGELVSLDASDPPPLAPATLEGWRAASQGLGRVVLGVIGAPAAVDAVTSLVLREPEWPAASAVVPRPPAEVPPEAPHVYDGAPDVAPGAARVTVIVHTADAFAAVSAAGLLGDRDGPLLTRLRALDPGVALRDVTAAAQAGEGCVALSLDVPHVDPRAETDAGGVLATTAAIARQEARRDVASGDPGAWPLRSATLAGDAREAADLAAWWGLLDATSSRVPGRVRDSLLVGVAASADPSADFASRARAVEAGIERASALWQAGVVDARRTVERGQGSLWMLLGSPCGTLVEGEGDAGLSALSLSALVEQVRGSAHERGVELSEWITSEGVGIVARASRRDGETPVALARRVADVAGSALTTGAVDPGAIGRARAELMAAAGQDDTARSFAALAEALTPGHASWSFPLATASGLEAWSDGAVTSRIAALRRGPLRLAVLGNDDPAQVDAAVQAVDRWVPRSPAAPRSCPPITAPPAPRPGVYPAPPAVQSSAWLAIPLPRGASSSPVADAASTVAAALDGPDGLLAHALSSGLASSWSAKIVGPREAAALVLHVGASARTLDAAVAQVRALLDRLRQGAFTEADRSRAAARLASLDLAASLEPRGRLVRLWRGDPAPAATPSLEAVRAWLADGVHDDGLVIVASRPAPAKALP
jgi:hypothetical protein